MNRLILALLALLSGLCAPAAPAYARVQPVAQAGFDGTGTKAVRAWRRSAALGAAPRWQALPPALCLIVHQCPAPPRVSYPAVQIGIDRAAE